MNSETTIAEVNRLAEEGKLFWVAGLIRDTLKLSQHQREQLRPAARLALEHYRQGANLVCAWCQMPLGVNPEVEGISHGICSDCLAGFEGYTQGLSQV